MAWHFTGLPADAPARAYAHGSATHDVAARCGFGFGYLTPRVKSDEQQATSNEQRATSNEQRLPRIADQQPATSFESGDETLNMPTDNRTTSNEQRVPRIATSNEQRATSNELRI